MKEKAQNLVKPGIWPARYYGSGGGGRIVEANVGGGGKRAGESHF